MYPITILVKEIRFIPNGNTIWAVTDSGKVLLQITTRSKVVITETACENAVCHADILTADTIKVGVQPEQSNQLPQAGTVNIPAGAIEFHPGGRTLWVQSPVGATVLRIKSWSQILIRDVLVHELFPEDDNFFAEVMVDEEIGICLVQEVAAQIDLGSLSPVNTIVRQQI